MPEDNRDQEAEEQRETSTQEERNRRRREQEHHQEKTEEQDATTEGDDADDDEGRERSESSVETSPRGAVDSHGGSETAERADIGSDETQVEIPPVATTEPTGIETETLTDAVLGDAIDAVAVPQLESKTAEEPDPLLINDDVDLDEATQRRTAIPQFHLETREVHDITSLKDTTPLVERTSSSVVVPQIQPAEPEIDRIKEVVADSELLTALEEEVVAPQITTDDAEQLEPSEEVTETTPDIRTTPVEGSENNTEVRTAPEKFVEKEQEEEEDEYRLATPKEQPAERESSTGTAADIEIEDEWITGDWPDPLELLLGAGGTNIKADHPILVLVNDELIGVVQTLLKRIHRERVSGEPKLTDISSVERLAKEARWIDADSRVFTVQLSDEEWKRFENEFTDKWLEIWESRIDELLFGQSFGAIVFNRTQMPIADILTVSRHPPKYISLEGNIDWKKIAQIFWEIDRYQGEAIRTFSQLFDDVDGIAQKRLKDITSAAGEIFNSATSEDEAASEEHYQMKVLVVKYLTEKLWEDEKEFTGYDEVDEIDYREIEETISTEEPIPTQNSEVIRPDIQHNSRVFEVETLFNEGTKGGVTSKLQKTVRKYEDVEADIEEVNIIVDNLACLLHLKEIAGFKRRHQRWEKEEGIQINMYTPDLGNEELVPVAEIVDELQQINDAVEEF